MAETSASGAENLLKPIWLVAGFWKIVFRLNVDVRITHNYIRFREYLPGIFIHATLICQQNKFCLFGVDVWR